MEAINIYPELVKHRKDARNLCSIYIRIDYQRKHIGVDGVGHKVSTDDWDHKKRRVKNSVPNSSLINSIIDSKVVTHNNFVLKR